MGGEWRIRLPRDKKRHEKERERKESRHGEN
jgi:hypothetical protein